MHRILILIAGFLIAVSGMLFLQGGNRDTRDLAAVSPDLGEIEIEGVSQLSARTASPLPSTDATSDLTDAVRASVAPPVAQDDSMADMTSSVLAGLGIGTAPAQDDAMEQVTAAVLASLSATGLSGNVQPTEAELRSLIQQSLRAGESDAYMDALLNEAVTTGSVQVPQALITADGRVDTRTILASIVQQSMSTSDDATIQALAAEAGVTVEPLARPETTVVNGAQYYVVEPGDSLAYIALVFYGDGAKFEKIFEANRDLIARPDMIRVGQKLLIPG